MNPLPRPKPATIIIAAALTPALVWAGALASGASAGVVSGVGFGAAILSALVGVALLQRRERARRARFGHAAGTLGAPFTEPEDLAETLARGLREARRTRADADASLRRLRVITDALDEAILAINQAELLLYVNRAACELFQISPERAIGAGVQDVLTQAALLGAVRRGLRGDHPREQVHLTTRVGPRIFEVSSGPIPVGAEDDGAVLILRDVTDLAQAARMKTDFVANASHELRTPLAAIRAALDTARAVAEDDPTLLLRFIDMVPAHLRRLEEMTGDLMDLSRLENPDLRVRAEPLSRLDLREALLSLCADAAKDREGDLLFDLDEALDGFLTDPRLVQLIAKNLVDNALKFCHRGGVVRVSAAVAPGDGAARRARFEVRDSGIGIPLNQQQRVFERFYQVNEARTGGRSGVRARRGTGLGLSIVKHAVGALDGEVGLESVYHEGTTVWFVIPEGRPTDDHDPRSDHRSEPRSDASEDADLEQFER